MVILLLALIVLGPQKLPEAARSVGRFTSEIRRMSNGFRAEMKAAFDAESILADDPVEARARERGRELVGGEATADADATATDATDATDTDTDGATDTDTDGATATDATDPAPSAVDPADEP